MINSFKNISGKILFMKNWVFLFYFFSGLWLFSNSLNNKFLLDDYAFLSNPVMSQTQYMLSQWNPYREEALGVLDNQSPLYYRPLTHMLYDFCYATFKFHFWQYHLLNLVLFVFASWLIYRLVEMLTGDFWLAFLTGFFYLIHPVNGIMVNYASANVFALQLICMLAAIVFLFMSLQKGRNRFFYFLSLVFSFLSLFWHESGVAVAFYVAAAVFLFRDDRLREKVSYLSPYFLIIFVYFVVRLNFFANGRIFENMAVHRDMAFVFQAYAWYISRLFYPQGIVMIWACPINHGQILWNVLGLCLLCFIFLLLFVMFHKRKIVRLALLWFLMGLLVASWGAFGIGNAVEIEPHWFVFSSIGFFIITAYFCVYLLNLREKIGWGVLLAVIVLWTSCSYAYNQLWHDGKTYTLYWSKQVPGFQWIYGRLAENYEMEGDFKEAQKYYRMALSGWPSDLNVYVNLAFVDLAQGDLQDAESDCRKALKIDPHSAAAYEHLGSIYFKEGRWRKAVENYQQALIFDPFLTKAKYQLALIYLKEKDTASLKKYASLYINAESDPGKLTRWGTILAENGYFPMALDCFSKAVHVDPNYKDAYLQAGVLLANLGRYHEAVHIWQLGSGLDPADQRFKNNIARAMAASNL